ncbi:MAG: PEGA domain-containing protein [Patescibacteria group bacterium]
MSKKTRDYIFWIFSVIFLLGTIFVSLYASGYKLNLSWPLTFNRLLLKTGMISIETEPRGVTIFLNGALQKNFSLNPLNKEYLTTPAKVKNVSPGEYDLRLELDGYWPLNKRISVYSGQTTFAENINLFRSNLPLLISNSPISQLQLSSSGRYLFVAAPSKIINLKNNETQNLSGAAAASYWLENEDKLVSGGQIFTPDSSRSLNYEQVIGLDAKNWYYASEEKRLYYQNNDLISCFDISSQRNSLIISGHDYSVYRPHGQIMFLIENKLGKTKLQKYSLVNQKIEQEISLPADGRYLFKDDSGQYLSLYDEKNQTLYLINPDNINYITKTLNQAISWQWIDKSHLFYNNNWEIYLVDLENNNESLLTRLGEEIQTIIYNKNNNYLIYTSRSGLHAYDLQVGISTKIFSNETVVSPVIDQKNNTLYFWAKIDQQAGVYKLRLQ